MNAPVNVDELFSILARPIEKPGDKDLIADAFALLAGDFVVGAPSAEITTKPGPKPLYGRTMTPREYKTRHLQKKRRRRLEAVAILDMETDPFDNVARDEVLPFLAVLYSNNFDPVVIWEENLDTFISAVIKAIEDLPEPYVIYAHNGGKFDFLFLMKKLRGAVKFKGRGIMSAMIGDSELRDSFHIIPERLANYKKDDFDYSKMRRGKREKFRQQIIDYCINDCAYLLEIIQAFLETHGFRYSIGQAAMRELKKHYKVARLGNGMDEKLRQWFFGGRTQCLAGAGHFVSDHLGQYKLFDINSQYPDRMANCKHPIGSEFEFRTYKGTEPGPYTYFMRLKCRNYGALVSHDAEGDVTTEQKDGEFFTTIWEYRAAVELGLIDNVEIISCVDCFSETDFSKFVLPLYEKRQATKKALKILPKGTPEYNNTMTADICMKLLLNNAYGKFAQNPRRYKDYFVCDPGEEPEISWFGEGNLDEPWTVQPHYKGEHYWIWQKPAPGRYFNNVATAASITGAARAMIMRAIDRAVDPIYCDTDSLICRDLRNVEIHNEKLGAWKLEQSFDEVIITGKKQYGAKVAGFGDCDPERIKIRSKGTQLHATAGELRALPSHIIGAKNRAAWDTMNALLDGEILEKWNKAPTLDRYGGQHYIKRRIRATAPLGTSLIVERAAARRQSA